MNTLSDDLTIDLGHGIKARNGSILQLRGIPHTIFIGDHTIDLMNNNTQRSWTAWEVHYPLSMKCFKIVCLLLFLFKNCFSQTGEKTAKISCDQMNELIVLASKNFEGNKLGKKEQVADPGYDSYYSNKSFGLEGKTMIDVSRDNSILPMLYASLYFGIDPNRSKIEYSKLVLEFDACLIKLGFIKKIVKKKDSFDEAIERTTYDNFNSHIGISISIGAPFYTEAVNGVPVKYVPYDLIELQVSHWN